MGYMSNFAKQMSKAAKEDERSNEELAIEIQQGNANLIEILFYKNFGLIYRIIQPYMQHYSEDDLFQEAFLGLYDAIFKFDPGRGSFVTIFPTYILNRLRNYDREWKGLPHHVHSDVNAYRRTFAILMKEIGRKPTISEMSKHLGWSEKKTEEVCLLTFDLVSLDSLVPGEEDLYYGGLVEDTRQSDMINNVLSDKFAEELWKKIESIIDKAGRDILFLNVECGYSLKHIANRQNMSIEAVKIIQNEAITKLRKNREFRQFLEKSDSLFCGSYLYGDSFTSFKNLQGSRIEESIIRKDKMERDHKGRIEVIEANHNLTNHRISRLHK